MRNFLRFLPKKHINPFYSLKQSYSSNNKWNSHTIFAASGDVGVVDLRFEDALKRISNVEISRLHKPSTPIKINDIEKLILDHKAIGNNVTLFLYELYPEFINSKLGYEIKTSIIDSNNSRMTLSNVFKYFREALDNSPIDIILSINKSFLATTYVPFLPKGSKVINLQDCSETDYLIEALLKNNLQYTSAIGLLEFHLAKGMLNRYIPPRIAVSGMGVIDLCQTFQNSIGLDVSYIDYNHVYENLEHLIEVQEINEIISKITEVSQIPLKQYGKAVLISLFLGQVKINEFNDYKIETETGVQIITRQTSRDYGLGKKYSLSSAELYDDPLTLTQKKDISIVNNF
ncbi:MAG: hypothetical protein ISQ32_02250 [Rickettsiales bacterium]|nr:hypothetical protein [Rickettsiales bacterium]